MSDYNRASRINPLHASICFEDLPDIRYSAPATAFGVRLRGFSAEFPFRI